MNSRRLLASFVLLLLVIAAQSSAQERIRIPENPAISPDGTLVAFDWRGDVWVASVADGLARRLTLHSSKDTSPLFSPDGNTIAFLSGRSGNTQIHTVPTRGGVPKQVSVITTRKRLLGYSADGKSLLIGMATDRAFARPESSRIFLMNIATGQRTMLVDCGGAEGALSPDGNSLVFTRGRANWTRKGYQGSQALQLWVADLTQTPAAIRRLDSDRPHFQNISKKAPMWMPDSQTILFASDPDGTFDIYSTNVSEFKPSRISNVAKRDGSDDGIAMPSLSANGKTLLVRRKFDLLTIDVASGKETPLKLVTTGDSLAGFLENREDTSTSTVAFTDDGKQMAFVAGADIFVMDRVLREPVRVTHTPHVESDLVFSRDGKKLYWVSDCSGEPDIWMATHDEKRGYWWLATEFEVKALTNDSGHERSLQLSPDGKTLAFVRGTNIHLMNLEDASTRQLTKTWSAPSFDWAPDSKWMVYTSQDDNYNSDVFIQDIAGERSPFNLSRHPDRDGGAVWSPDGTRIVFTGRRDGEESDIYHVVLAKADEEKTSRDRKMEDALKAMKKSARSSGSSSKKPSAATGGRPGVRGRGRGRRRGRNGPPAGRTRPAPEPAPEEAKDEQEKKEEKKPEPKKPVVVKIDFDGILERIHRIRIPDSTERGLLFSPKGKTLVFSATVKGESGVYSVEFPDPGTPKKIGDSSLRSARWLSSSDEIVGISSSRSSGGSSSPRRGPPRSRRGRFGMGGGVPAAMKLRGEMKRFDFSVRTVRDWRALREASLDQAWRSMRDRFYDPKMNNRDWDAVRAKYRAVAGSCLGSEEFSSLVNMMLGELNASHMGHSGGSDPLPSSGSSSQWNATTYHLGLRYKMTDEGALVTSVIPKGPSSKSRSRVEAGELITALDGEKLERDSDIPRMLTRAKGGDVKLTVRPSEGEEREVTVRPVTSVSGLLYEEWVDGNREQVSKLSKGRLGYLHIRGMNMSSFRQMEEDLFHAGDGKDGIIIDVRFNGGGSTTDHVLTALTQPTHAITISRGSGEGYPQDRKIYASWTKPIVLMCNQHSFSNAEILSHAVKQLGRGRLVGMRTAGGVISTGSARLLDGSRIRMPTRGWFLESTGADMELNGCEPDIAIWNQPNGPDDQLREAVRALGEDVKKANAAPKVIPVRAAEMRK